MVPEYGLGNPSKPLQNPLKQVRGHIKGPELWDRATSLKRYWAPGFNSPNRIVWGSLLRKKVGRSGWMGGPRQRGWAPIGLPSCLLSGLLGRMGGPQQRGWAPIVHVSFLGFWVGWVGRGNGARLPLGSLHVSFLGSWVGWVGRGNGAGLPLGSLHVSFLGGSDGWAAATGLGFH